jgi:serine phosphatase RsbU (regulator of sigma subunit)
MLLTITNARLHGDLEPGRFVTAFLGILDHTGLLHWSSAGHGPVLAKRSPSSEIETLDPPGPPLGVIDEFLADRVDPIQLLPGGTLLVMSDGIFEAFDPTGEQFGVGNVEDIFKSHVRGPGDLLESIRTSVRAWQQKIEPVDDQTLVIAQVAE